MQYIIVLGNTNFEICKQRCKVAADYFCNNCITQDVSHHMKFTGRIICSGGATSKNTSTSNSGSGNTSLQTEASIMKNILLEMHIPENVIVLEPLSLNTEENLMYCRKLLIKYNIISDTSPQISIVVCTSTFHAARSYAIAQTIFVHDHVTVKTIHGHEHVDYETAKKELWLLGAYLQRNHYKFTI
jgi:uncharacterized SAM-binding protein YcdF (DUF218 family)